MFWYDVAPYMVKTAPRGATKIAFWQHYAPQHLMLQGADFRLCLPPASLTNPWIHQCWHAGCQMFIIDEGEER